MSHPPNNAFTDGSLYRTYARTALPIIFVMGMNGLLSVVDAVFLGTFVGPAALAAVTLMFPAYMLIVALSTLVSNGMSSQLARFLGAKDVDRARGVFVGAHGLAVLVGGCLIGAFALFGRPVSILAAGGETELAEMGLTYLRITVCFSPLLFVLSVNSDALRNEGRVGFMAAMSLLVSLSNIGFNYVLIAVFDLGVAGSAYGTAAAHALAFAIIASFRVRGATVLRPSALLRYRITGYWGRILALGAPQSLNFLGLALGSGAILTALHWTQTPRYADITAAYGVITRVITFAYLPLLGLSLAMQTITGNNYGAQNWRRSDASLRIALWLAVAYCAVVQLLVSVFPEGVARIFVDATGVIDEITRILPIMTSVFVLMGPLMMIAAYFQTIGAARRAMLLSLAKPYCFAIPLTFLFAGVWGEPGIWLAGPMAELCLLALTVFVLRRSQAREGLKWGVFHTPLAGAAQ